LKHSATKKISARERENIFRGIFQLIVKFKYLIDGINYPEFSTSLF